VTQAPSGTEAPPAFYPPEPDADSIRFWEWARQHRLLLQRCDGCGTFRWPPRTVCWSCGATGCTEVPASGRATLYSWTVIHHPTMPVATERLPYTVLLAALEEDPRILIPGQFDGDRADLRPGAPLRCTFHPVSDEVTVVHWSVVEDSAPEGGGPVGTSANCLDPWAAP
jgi:uncharacterized OB-fold protein